MSLEHPLRSVFVMDSRELTPFAALAEVEHRFMKANPSLLPRDFRRVDIRRVHEGGEIEGAPA